MTTMMVHGAFLGILWRGFFANIRMDDARAFKRNQVRIFPCVHRRGQDQRSDQQTEHEESLTIMSFTSWHEPDLIEPVAMRVLLRTIRARPIGGRYRR